jgi:cytochrome c-type biogenesis protein CcmH/NrfG
LAAEAKVVQAWMLGEADRTYLEKSRVFVGKVVRLYPNNPRVRFCYAALQKRANKLDSAIQEFARVVELDPSHTDAQQELELLMQQRRDRRRR